MAGAEHESEKVRRLIGDDHSGARGIDIRIPFAGLLLLYVVLGLTVLGFNRSPWQAALTVTCAVAFDFALGVIFRKQRTGFPWSGLITGLGLCLLLSYGTHPWMPVVPAFLAIASKYLITVNGRHVFNPTLFGLVVGLWASGGMISPAPAYQWGGSLALALFLVALAFMIFLFRVGRSTLVLSFLGFYGIQMALRAWIVRYHLPPETIFLGTLTSAPFFLFTFYMLTDPKTSPKSAGGQVALAFAVTVADLWFHTRQSYSTLFPALFWIQAGILLWRSARALMVGSLPIRFPLRRVSWIAGSSIVLWAAFAWQKHLPPDKVGFRFTRIDGGNSGIEAQMSDVLNEVDPGLRHIAKWVLSVGDAAATADVDGDGLLDIFLTNPLKRAQDRCSLLINRGGLTFERVALPSLDELCNEPERQGLPSCAVFADYDNDGDQDLFVGVGFGPSRLLANRLTETGALEFEDVTAAAGLSGWTTCLSALFCDFDQDNDLDLLVGNSMPPYLPDYEKPTPLNVFDLPDPKFEGDQRMYHFMHSSWHRAENGGENVFYRNCGDGSFEREDCAALGMPETHWTLALNAADFNRDGWPDVYAASDFGPDDLYFNQAGKGFARHQGRLFGSVGKDTFKGMNCSLADFDRNGFLDIYVSNVHVPLQAEGSLLWMIGEGKADGLPEIRNEAARRGALNEHNFGWGAAAGDIDGDGWIDIVQANGMVDDRVDRRFDSPRDYWYVNGQLARTGPEVHSYANKWADIRGYSIFGQQRNRLLINDAGKGFADVAEICGMGDRGNSRGMVLADFDNDGDLDLVVTHQFETAELFRNDREADRPWIGLQLVGDGVTVNRDAANARVEIREDDGQLMVAEVMNVSGFSAQGDRRIYFGLETDSEVDVSIAWRADRVTHHRALKTRRYHRIVLPPTLPGS